MRRSTSRRLLFWTAFVAPILCALLIPSLAVAFLAPCVAVVALAFMGEL